MRVNISIAVFYTMLLGLILFVMYEAIKTPYFNPLALPIPFLMWIGILLKNEFLPGKICNPNFITLTGVIGSYVPNEVERGPGNEKIAWVYVKRRYAPKKSRGTHSSGIKDFFALLSGNVRIPVKGHKDDFIAIDPLDCEAPEGAMLFLGSIAGFEVKSLDYNLREQLKKERHEKSISASITREMKASAEGSSHEDNANLLKASHKLGVVQKNVQTKVKILDRRELGED